MKSFTDELEARVISKRGPYDLFTGERNKPISVGYFALPVRAYNSLFVYEFKVILCLPSFMLCSQIGQFYVPPATSSQSLFSFMRTRLKPRAALLPVLRRWHGLHICPRLALVVAYFPALGTGCIFPRPLHRFHIFPPLAPVAFSLLAPVARFPALGTVCMFSRAWHVFALAKFCLLRCVNFVFY